MADATTVATLDAVARFNEAFNAHDVDAVMALMTDDCLFDCTRPPPDGERVEGQAAVRAYWEAEAVFGCGDRAVVRWTYRWVRDGQSGRVRGVDVFRVRDGKVSEKRSYVKG